MTPGDPFRWCIYCNADCYEDDPEHAADCPSITGLWPIRERDLRAHDCPNCKCAGGMRCAECAAEFASGDFYVLRDDDTGEVVARPEVGVVVCVGCAALSPESNPEGER